MVFRFIFGSVLVGLVALAGIISNTTVVEEGTESNLAAEAPVGDDADPGTPQSSEFANQSESLSDPSAQKSKGDDVSAKAKKPDGPPGQNSTTTTTVPSTSTTAAGDSSTTSPTTTTPKSTVTPPPPSSSKGKGEGQVDLLVNAKSAFDKWTKSPSSSSQATMRSLYDWMVVFSPYFDSRLSWYPNGLAYIDLYAIYTDTGKDQRSLEHPEWILKDGAGNNLYLDWGCSGGTCPQYAADTGNAEFRQDFVNRVGALLAKGYPGVMIDDVNLLWRISNGNGDTVPPIDPRTGQEMTLGAWQKYTVELLEMVRKAHPKAKIMHNAIWYADAPGYSNSMVRRQTAAADWIMLERGATDGGLKGGDGKFSLGTFMRFSDFAHSVGTNLLFLDETADSIPEQTYNLAVYLLVNNGSDLVSTEEYGRIAPGSTWVGFTADLGDAVGPRYRWNGLWRRDFSRGVVLVNDPGAGNVTVSLGGSYRDLDGNAVGDLTLGSRTAAVLSSP